MKAAPAAKTPFLMVWQKRGSADPAPKIVRYLVWWALVTEAANNHTSAVMENILIEIIVLILSMVRYISIWGCKNNLAAPFIKKKHNLAAPGWLAKSKFEISSMWKVKTN